MAGWDTGSNYCRSTLAAINDLNSTGDKYIQME